MNREVLRAPFPADLIRQRAGQGGKTLSYVEVTSVIARLNDGCDNWSFEVLEHHILEDEVVVIVKLTIDGGVRHAFGGSALTRDRDGRIISVADDLKAAASDGLKKAASLYGLGLEMYGGQVDGGRQQDERRHAPAPAPPRPATPTVSDRITTRQFAAIQSAARRRNIARERLGGLVEQRFQKSDLAQLTRREASSLIAELSEANGTHG